VDGSARSLVRVGDPVLCGECGTTTVVNGYPFALAPSQDAAIDGSDLACGHKMVSSMQRIFWWEDETALDLARSSQPGHYSALTRGLSRHELDRDRISLDENTSASTSGELGVTLRIALFFDGTNNNAANISLGLQCPASTGKALGDDVIDREAVAARCEPFMRKGSYQNGYTNIWRLHELYRESRGESVEPGGEYFARIYVDGIGTTAGQRDSLLTKGLGGGRSGVLARVQEVFEIHIVEVLNQFAEAHFDRSIGGIEFDVFGFSRGAAAARHFVNQANRRHEGPLGPVLGKVAAKLSAGFDWGKSLRIGFVGIFDTVAAMGSIADGWDVRDDDDRGVVLGLAADCARQVVHLVARDEIRANFMLTSAAPHREIELPGVHSDIGGSYRGMTEGPLWLTKPVGFNEGQVQPGDSHWGPAELKRSRAWVESEPALRLWQARLGIRDPSQLKIDAWEWIRSAYAAGQGAKSHRYVYAAVTLERPIDWRYQLIAFRLMHQLASEAGVQWAQAPDDIAEYDLPTELQPIAVKLLAGTPLLDGEERMLRNRYLHLSAHWNAITGKGPVGVDVIYSMRPDPTGRRQVRPNR